MGDEVTPLIVGEESLGSCRGEFHRQSNLPRCPEHEAELDIDPVACAEIAAHVEGQNAQTGWLDSEDGCHLVLLAHRPAASGIKRIASGLRFVMAERGARLHRNGGHALQMKLRAHDVIGGGKGRIGGFPVSKARVDEGVVGTFIPDDRSAGRDGAQRIR